MADAALDAEADVLTASDRYAQRFSGPVGQWFLERQAALTVELLRPFPGAAVLDVGGGHGQTARAVLGAGHRLTVHGTAGSCQHRLRPLIDTEDVAFVVAPLLALPFPDRSFDVVMAYRLLPHVSRWPELLREMARLARRAVIVDYPTLRSVNALSGALFGMKKGVEGDTRPFTVFRDAEVAGALRGAGLPTLMRRPQFLLPMALHRALGQVSLSRLAERATEVVGLAARLGSPVILRAERV